MRDTKTKSSIGSIKMIDLETVDKIYLYPGSTDLRKGMNALSDIIMID